MFDKLKSMLTKAAPDFKEIGTAGLRESSGFVHEEFHPRLQGAKGRQVYREMRDNDATVGAFLFAVENLLRAVEWRVEPADPDSVEAADLAEFYEGVFFEDMSHSWADFMSETLSMLVFGFHFAEIVLKRRGGPETNDPTQRSKFSDGMIGIRKLAPRSQETLHRWVMDDDGGVQGFAQIDSFATAGEVVIPIECGVLFRTTAKKNNPEGRSILRNAYRSWHFLKLVEESEAIGIERELAGLPVVRVPSALLTATDAVSVQTRNAYEAIARDLKHNDQGGLVFPSDPWTDNEGRPSSVRKVDVELMSTGGSRSIDTISVKRDYQNAILRSVLAQFLMLGSTSQGSFALSSDQSDLFVRALETVNDSIAAPLNRFVVPRMVDFNNQNRDLMPIIKPGRVAPVDLDELSSYILRLSQSGMPLFPDETLEEHLRDAGGLPDSAMDEDLRIAQTTMPTFGQPFGEPADDGDTVPQADDEDTGSSSSGR